MAESDKSVVVSSTTDFSYDSTGSDEWQELTKSDYAKVIFSDLLCNAALGTVECKFQITDNVHEDPNDYVGLFRIGYEDLSQCLVSKMLSQTKCEDDGKLQRCVFTADELPCLSDGFYQFLYVTRDQEVCGASMPFEIKMLSPSSLDSNETMDGGFLLVSDETKRKVKEEPKEQESISVQRSILSEQKKEEIAAWVSQNPDYDSLIEQIKEHTFLIETLQQSKDLAMREVGQLYEVSSRQSTELIQMQNMMTAYEEKIKMCQCLQAEKNMTIAEMEKKLADYERKIKLYEKEENLRQVKSEFLLQEERLKASLSFQDQQQTEINDLKRELEGMKEMQKVKKSEQVITGPGRHSIDCLIQKTQDLLNIVSDSIENLDHLDEVEVDKYYQLKIQLLIILRKVTTAIELANTCDQNGPQRTTPEVPVERDVQGGCPVCASCSLADEGVQDPVEASVANTSASEVQKTDIPTSSIETPPLSGSGEKETTEKETTNENASNPDVQSSASNKAFESEVLEHQITELPRLNVINQDTARMLQADKPLDEEDIAVVNRLTEKIMNRGVNLFEAIDLIDESDCESDVSEISECSSMKKDMVCVSRVIAALSSYFSNQTNLDYLFVVEKEEDKSLIQTNKWDVLLQKCALRYQIELLLEYIEKQREGTRKVSDKICELLTKCMVYKDDMEESRMIREMMYNKLDRQDMYILKYVEDLKRQKKALDDYRKQNEELVQRTDIAEKTVLDLHTRLEEAADLYRKQYADIRKLTKKLQKYKSMKEKIKSSDVESSLVSSQSSKTSSSSFEVVKIDSAQNTNDSDTGEHMFEKASSVSKEEIQVEVNSNTETVPERCLSPPAASDDVLPSDSESKSEESSTQAIDGISNAETAECKSNQTATLLSDFSSYEEFQEVIKESFANIQRPIASRNSQERSISCYMCKKIVRLGPETPVDLMNHLESEHSMKTCPVCGQVFEDAIPPRYFHIHVERHFETQ